MRFALFCDDSRAKPLIDGVASGAGGHQLVCAVRITPQADLLLHGRAGVRFVDHWEDLLTAKDIDAVIVGGSDDSILEGAKQLATAGTPLLFLPRSDQQSTFIYELNLIRDDNHVVLWPIFWHRFDIAARRLKQAIDDGELGRIQFLELQRAVHQSTPGAPITPTVVDNELLADVDVPRWLMGDYDQITCLQTAASEVGIQMQTVVLAGRSLPETNWSINSTSGPDPWKLTVRGEKGIAVLKKCDASNAWIFERDGDRVEGDERDTVGNALTAFSLSMKKEQELAGTTTIQDPTPNRTWDDLVKCFETVDATHRSLKRRRTIELHFESMSERSIFKTQMTAIGCSLLMATFFLTLAYLGIASLIPLPSWALIGLRTLVFAPLILFLLAQLLLPLTRPSSAELTANG
jgi:predicted dehydrogenase